MNDEMFYYENYLIEVLLMKFFWKDFHLERS